MSSARRRQPPRGGWPGPRFQSVTGEDRSRFRIFDRDAEEPTEAWVEADLDSVLPVGAPEDRG